LRHRVYGKHLGRNKNSRKALFTGLVRSLFSHGTIQTSLAKAKAISGLVDKIINKAKKYPKTNTLKFIPKLGTRTSGYTSITKLGTRLGDQTMMVKMSLIGAEELRSKDDRPLAEKPVEKKIEKKKTK